MYTYAIRLPIPEGLSQTAFPHLAAVVQQLAQLGLARWQGYAQNAPLPSGGVIGTRSGAYLKSIQLATLGEFSYEIYSDAPYAAAIEFGTGARDLKRILDSSLKVRVTAKGKRYLVIPFRWGTGTGSGGGVSFGRRVMPPEIHEAASQLEPTRIVGHGWRPSGTGAWSVRTHAPLMVRQRQYRWGERLPAGLAPKLKPTHVTDPFAGMVKFQHPTRGGSRDTHYMTFRTMVEGGRGWIVPAQAGKYPARAVADELNRRAPALLQRAFEEDLRLTVAGG
jgi:hypothetical protein